SDVRSRPASRARPECFEGGVRFEDKLIQLILVCEGDGTGEEITSVVKMAQLLVSLSRLQPVECFELWRQGLSTERTAVLLEQQFISIEGRDLHQVQRRNPSLVLFLRGGGENQIGVACRGMDTELVKRSGNIAENTIAL